MKKLFVYTLSLLILSISSAGIQAAEIKKWTDENGRVYYGDTPPVSVTAKTVKTSKRPSNIGKPLPRLSVSDSTTKAKKPATSATPDSLEPEQAKVACDNATQDLLVINNSARIQLRAADGTLRYMTKDEINQRRQRSQENIDKFCN